MFKEQDKKNNITEEKISWYRKRWFWGVVLAPILIFGSFIFLFEMPLMILRIFSVEVPYPHVFLIYLPYSFIIGISMLIPIETPIYSYYMKTVFTPLSHFLSIIYCLILLFLFYKIFREKRVKIKYPIILLVIFIFSIFGYILLFAVS